MELGDNKLDVKSNIRDLIRQIPLLGFIIIKLKWSFSTTVPTASIDKRVCNKLPYLTAKERGPVKA